LFLFGHLFTLSNVKMNRIEVAGGAAVSVALVIQLFGANLKADFGLVDDHQILTFIDHAARGFRDFFHLFRFSEIVHFGMSNRYRPGYYTLYIFESLLWGPNPFLWYLSRLFMAAVFIFACTYVIGQAYGLGSGVLFVFLVFSYPYWTDIWSRLGPGESYCAFGLALFAITFERLWNLNHAAWYWSFLLALAVFIAAGAKENFVLLLIPVLVLAYGMKVRRKLSRHALAAITFSVLYITLIVLELVIAFAEAGTDFYANPVSLSSRAATLISAARIPAFIFAVCSAVSATTILSVFRVHPRLDPSLRSRILQIAWISFATLLLLLSQTVFYNGEWPTGMRYDFPGMLATPLLMIAILDLVSTAIYLQYPRVRPALILLLVLIAFVPQIQSGMNDIYEGSNNNVVRTQSTKAKIATIVRELKASPNVPLILESHDPIDNELIMSLKIFLRHFGVGNPVYVRVHAYTAEAQRTELFRTLAKSVIAWSKMDESEVLRAKQCYSVHFRGQSQTSCKTLAQF